MLPKSDLTCFTIRYNVHMVQGLVLAGQSGKSTKSLISKFTKRTWTMVMCAKCSINTKFRCTWDGFMCAKNECFWNNIDILFNNFGFENLLLPYCFGLVLFVSVFFYVFKLVSSYFSSISVLYFVCIWFIYVSLCWCTWDCFMCAINNVLETMLVVWFKKIKKKESQFPYCFW